MKSGTKPKFKRRLRLKARPAETLNTEFGSKRFKVVSTESKLTEMEMLITEWTIKYPPSLAPNKFLRDVKRFSVSKAQAYLKAAPAHLWHERRRGYQDMILKDQVKSQLDWVAEMNDLHLRASKLGLAKAIEMLTKMEIKQYIDKNGDVKFSRFKSTDLKNCLESISIAQKIQRTALGLPSDEGAIHIWQQLNIQQNNLPPGSQLSLPAGSQHVSPEGIGNALSYDEIKLLIEAQREGKLEVDTSTTIDVESDQN